jgi:hypothetical protein
LAAPKQGLKHELAEREVAADQLAELGPRDSEHRPGLAHDPGRAGSLPGEQVEFDHQIARPLADELTGVLAASDDDRHAALKHGHHVVMVVPVSEQHFAFSRRAHLPMSRQQLHLRFSQLGKQRRILGIEQSCGRGPAVMSAAHYGPR